MGIVLLEPTDTGEAGEGTGQLVAVEGAKVGEPKGKVAVRPNRTLEHEAVARAVHGLHGPLLSFDVEAEHGVLVVHGVSRLVPKVEVVDVGGDDLVVAALPVVVLDEVDELVVDAGAVGEPEGRPGRQVVEHDELLLLHDAAVIALLGLLVGREDIYIYIGHICVRTTLRNKRPRPSSIHLSLQAQKQPMDLSLSLLDRIMRFTNISSQSLLGGLSPRQYLLCQR